MRKFLCVLSIIVLLLSAACSREWRDPDTALPAQSVSIATILANPDAYDMCGVVVIGKIWRPKVESMGVNEYGVDQVYTVFTIADRNGIGMDVYVNGEAPVADGEYIRVVGVYRKEFQTEGDYFYSRIDAVRLESWSPNLTYWIREFEFD
ncbi:MAG TPA: hypothetical protein VJV40_10240 [Thermodesulfobacteriota bacterium]|nr:hypothetical protein [Thermodesulfobacteriota bacterium]